MAHSKVATFGEPGTIAKFDYQEAFSRNIGWISELEQQRLRSKKIAIAGMGGVGSAHLLVLARLGVGQFNIADLDTFEIANFNRQAGAMMSTIGRTKVDVMAEMARDINPEIEITGFPNGVDDNNIDAFLEGADLYVDGLDFFVMGARRKVFARCAEMGIPAITAAPVGFGVAYIVFLPGKMTFEQLFRLEGLSEAKQYVSFATGLTPSGFHRPYLVDAGRLDLSGKRGPSTGAAINLCAGAVAAEATKVLLGRGRIFAAPWVHQFDAFRSRWRRSFLPFGNRGPLQTLKRVVGYKVFAALSRNARPKEEPFHGSEIERILALARWSPSGDNLQPWRFEIVNDETVIVRVQTEGEEKNIYDFNRGQPTLLSAGFLVETMRIAASKYGRRVDWRHTGADEGGHRVEITLKKDPSVEEDALFAFIAIRSVNRFPYRMTPLSRAQKSALEAALGEGLELRWMENIEDRWRMAKLNAKATDIRLRLRAAYDVHERILDWNRRYSLTGVPATAVGLDAMTLKLMRWVMADWRRVAFMNRFLAGTVMPRLQLDILPGLRCAAHFTISKSSSTAGATYRPQELLATGMSLQRFWLTATSLGLSLQPGLAPLCFATYAREDRVDLYGKDLIPRIKSLNANLSQIADDRPEAVLFAGRLGVAADQALSTRSLRLSLDRLMVSPS